MWGKRRKPLSKRETLGLLARLMEQAEQEQQEAGAEPEETNPYYEGPLPVPPPSRPGLRVVDVPVDNSAGPEPAAADEPGREPQAPQQQDLPAQRQGESSRHRSF